MGYIFKAKVANTPNAIKLLIITFTLMVRYSVNYISVKGALGISDYGVRHIGWIILFTHYFKLHNSIFNSESCKAYDQPPA
jgi:hypothetical protein